jgi:N-methylhydantoinase A
MTDQSPINVSSETKFQIGIDVGGTFTDLVAVGGGAPIYLKTPTGSGGSAAGVTDGIGRIAEQLNVSVPELLSRTNLIVHGTTVATNMMIEGTGSRVGMLTTAGFRDDLEYRRGLKEEIYDPTLAPPRQLVRRRDRLTVDERVGADGKVVRPLDEDGLRQQIRTLKDNGCTSVVVGFLFSFLNADHEQRTRQIVEEEWPGVYMSVSSDILPQVREYERFSTTVVNSYVGPGTADYLRNLESELEVQGFGGEFLVILSNGGVIDGQYASDRPASMLLSGPAGGVLAATEVIAKKTDLKNLITIDMGGTSCDVCVVPNAQPQVTSTTYVERHAVSLPMLAIHTIGAGGGSLARVDAGGVLRVGPQSAGATPGPACYGRGGELPTVTDANLALGYLNPDATLGGSVTLDQERARQVIDAHVGTPMGLPTEQAALGVLRMINAHMTNGIRVVSVQQGHDPRDFALVAFGGNGAVHAVRQAEDLDIKTIIVPRMAGALSALGGLHADASIDHLATWIGETHTTDGDALGKVFKGLCVQGEQVLGGSDVSHAAQLACHYAGQTSEILVTVEWEGGEVSAAALANAAAEFHRLHEQERSFAKRDEGVLIAGLKVTSSRAIEHVQSPQASAQSSETYTPEPGGERDVYYDAQSGWTSTPIYTGEAVQPGAYVAGPAIIEESDTTIVVYPGWVCRLDDNKLFLLTRDGGAS